MKQEEIKKRKKDAWLASIERALTRAAQKARKVARFYGTPIDCFQNSTAAANCCVAPVLAFGSLAPARLTPSGPACSRPSRSFPASGTSSASVHCGSARRRLLMLY